LLLEKRQLELEERELALQEQEKRQNIFKSSEKMGMEGKDNADNYQNLTYAERKLLQSIVDEIATQTGLELELLQAFEYNTNNEDYKKEQRLLTKTLEELREKKDNLQKLNEIRGKVEALKDDLPNVEKNLRENKKLTLQEASDYMDAYKKDIKKLKENEEYLNTIARNYQEKKRGKGAL